MKPWRCPNCRHHSGVPVRYGLPSLKAADAARRGELVLGGCVLTDDGMLVVSGPGGDLVLHGSVPRLLLHMAAALFGRHGHRTIAEFREWLEVMGLDLVRAAG